MANTTLGEVVNEGVQVIGEPQIDAFVSTNQLHTRLINSVNDGITVLKNRTDFDWLLKHTTLTLKDELTTGNVLVSNESTLVTSVDSVGASAANFANVEAGEWFRRQGETDSYKVASIDTTGSPHVITLETQYVGDTATSGSPASYRVLKDTYSITDTDLDQIQLMAHGQAADYLPGVSYNGNNKIEIVSMDTLWRLSGGDLHRTTGGRPRYAARIAPDSLDQQRWVFWPFPLQDHLVQIWYDQEFSILSAFNSLLFGGDADRLALVAISHYVKATAYMWDEDENKFSTEMQQFNIATGDLVRKENREAKADQGFNLATYRRQYDVRLPGRSGIAFDTKSAVR